MQCQAVTQKDQYLPARLISLLGGAFPQITFAGNLDILLKNEAPITGLFCSRNCPGSLILPAFDHVSALRDQGMTVVSGFHSEMEQECLKILLRGTQPIIVCPARSINAMRIPADWKGPFADNRMLILSPFDKSRIRPTAKLATYRNKFISSLADENFVIHAPKDSDTFKMVVQIINTGKRIVTIKSTENQAIIEAGAVPF